MNRPRPRRFPRRAALASAVVVLFAATVTAALLWHTSERIYQGAIAAPSTRAEPRSGVSEADAAPSSRSPAAPAGLAREDVAIASELGQFPAWLTSGTNDTWVILVHGKGASREEATRMMRVLAPLGYRCLVITYRNDAEARPAPDGRYGYGATEWRDVESAVRYSLSHAARDIVLVGFSMGGGIVMSFLERSPERSRVLAAILESPMLDLEDTVDHGFKGVRLPLVGAPYPSWIAEISKRLAAWRYRFEWSDFDRLEGSGKLTVPVLVLHNEGDATVPIETSEALEARNEERVMLVRFQGEGHVECWDADPGKYGRAIGAFLAGVDHEGMRPSPP